jgi:gliding motility-associated-like protein
MKTILRFFLLLSFYLFNFPFAQLHAQGNNGSSWSAKFGYQKAFIENKGQFSIPNSSDNSSPVLFAVDHGGTKIYFTKKGITYSLLETYKKQKDDRELERERKEEMNDPEAHARHEQEERRLKVKKDQITMLWQNANNNTQIIASDVTSDYHSYYFKQANGEYKNESNIKGYKKLTYKNIYPNIDIEYVFHEKSGLKYSLTLRPGADPSIVKMVYDHHVSLNSLGEIHIDTKFGDIIDHAPLSFYQQNTASVISSNFIKNGKTVSFQLNNYDNTQTIIIDPWTQTPAFNTNWDCVWECETDAAGNAYLIGGVMPMQLIKYNAAGVLQWTYNTPYDTTAWLGTFAVDNVGNSYVTQGAAAKIVKVSTAGAVVWNNGSPGGLFASTEFWNITFNCDQTRLVIGGTGNTLPPQPYVYEVNMANGNVTSSIRVTNGALIPTQEVRSIAPCGNGRYYFLTHDSIGYLNQTFNNCSNPNAALYKISNTYSFGYKCENFRYDNSGIMAIKANTSFVYTHRGDRLDKRSLVTGAIISSAAIPGGGFGGGFGGNSVQCSGIDIDDCGNVYVGSKNQVVKFDGNSLAQLASYPTTYNVYDVHVTTGGNIIACGSTGTSSTGSRSGTIQHISAGACNTLSLTCCDVNICQPPNVCSTAAAFNLQAATPGGTWGGPGITNATTGTFNPATAGIGTHVITYSIACGVGSVTVNVLSCGTVTLCLNGGTLNVGGGSGTYTLASTSTSVNCSACPGGNCLPFICAGTTVPTWSATGTSVTAPAAGVFPIKVTDTGTGTTFTFTSLASIPSCSTPTCPTLTLSVASQTNVNCFGANTGTASVSTSGGTGPYTYTWSPGNLNGASQSALSAGTYTISIKDANNCTGTGTVIITQPTASLSAVISATTGASCGSSTGGATVTASGGTAGYTYSWAPSGGTTAGVSNLAAGGNTVTITDSKGCTRTAVATINSASGPTLSVVSQASVNCFGASTGSASVNPTGGTGPYTYTWNPGNLSGSSQTGLAAGTYTINVADASQCSGTTTLTITQPTSAISAVISSTIATGCGTSTGGATVTASGGTPGYTYSWTPSGGTTVGVTNLGSGSNSVTVTDTKGCNVTVVANITTAGGPTLSVVSQASVNCFGASTGSATVNGNGGTAPYTYTWNPGNLSGASQTGLAAGTYTINITDAGLCAGSGTILISQPTTSLNAAITATLPAGCGTSTGEATVTASGGTPSYTYAWLPSGAVGSGATGLSVGNNTVIVVDANSCSVTAIANIISAGGPTLSVASQTNVNCFGASTGSATINATGGTGPFSYTWTPGNLSGSSQTGLSAGTYTVNVTDASSCASSTVVIISQPTTSISATISNTTAPACGLSNGSASVTANGGTPNYTYSWTPNVGSTPSVSNLSSGNSTVTVTDANGCSTSAVVTLASVSGPTLSVVSQGSVTCFGTNSGTATVNSVGGSGPYTYTWSPGNLTGATQTSLSAGIYTVTVQDANQCTGTGTVAVSQPTAGITGTISTTPTGCGTSVGSATVTANGGVPAYTYTWGPTAGSGTSISGLAAGSYSVIISDSKGCTVTVNTSISTTGTGPALSVTSQSNASCGNTSNGAANINATGTGPYTYTWTPTGGNVSSASGLAGGNYTVFVADASLCISTITINITQPPPIIVTVTSTPANCGLYDGTATANATGGNGTITYLWSTNTNSATASGLSSGTYSVLITDGAGCTATGFTNVNSVGTLTVDVGANVTILEGQSTQLDALIPFGANVVWTPTTGLSCTTCSNPIASPTVSTDYCALTTIGSCTNISCVSVFVETDCVSNSEYSAPNAFSPNGDGKNDNFCLEGWKKCVTVFYVAIYNKWGEKIYESEEADFCWDGTFRGKPLNPDVFVYYIKASIKDVGEIIRKGNVTLVK